MKHFSIALLALMLTSCPEEHQRPADKPEDGRLDHDGTCGWSTEGKMHVCGGESHPAMWCGSIGGTDCGDINVQGCCEHDRLWYCGSQDILVTEDCKGT